MLYLSIRDLKYKVKVATWNVNSLKVRLPHVIDWIESSKVDVLCLQETKQNNDNFPHEVFNQLGLYSYHNGQNTYNGVALISKKPLTNIMVDLPNFDDPQKRLISGNYEISENNKVRIISAYIPNGQSLDSEKFIYKKNWLKNFCKWIKQLADNKIIITGDFNIAPADIDCHDPEIWSGQNLVSKEERDYFIKILNTGFIDSFRLLNPKSEEYSWWDYRMAGFRRNLGMRIDHILVSSEIITKVTESYIDKRPRKLERPSDHTPVVTELK